MGLKRNAFYSTVLTISNYLFPLLIFPYVTRILGVENIGICNWVDGVIQYFVIFSMLGITTLGVREIAYHKSDYSQLSRTFSSLLAINLITTMLGFVALAFCLLFIPVFQEYKEMFYIGGAKLLINLFLIEWFYKGIENFKYITVRTIFVRLLYTLSVFIFVRERSDFQIFYLLTTFSVGISAFLNIVYSRKFVSIICHNLQLTKYIKPFVLLGVYMLLNSMYSTFNVAYLGVEYDKSQVGYYTTITRIFVIILALYSACTSVLMPRISQLVAESNIDKVEKLIVSSLDVLYTLALPIIILGIFFSPEIVFIVGGTEFNEAIPLLQMALPLILISGVEQILVIQILMPFKADKQILINSIVSALVGVILGLCLIKWYAAVGSVLTWIIVELSVLLLSYYFVRKVVKISLFTKTFWLNCLFSIPYMVIYFALVNVLSERIWVVAATLCLSTIYFGLSQYYLIKNTFIVQLLNRLCFIKISCKK